MPETLPQLLSASVTSRAGTRRSAWIRLQLQVVALVAVLSIVFAACSSSDSGAAATVDSVKISNSSVSSELATIAENPTVKAKAVEDGKLNPTVSAAWLTLIIQAQVAKAANEKAGTKIIEADRAEASDWADSYFGDAATFAKFPAAFRASTVKRYADVTAFVRTHTPPPTDADVRKAYDDSIVRNCASRRYVSHILVPTEDEAKAAAAEVAAGTDFKQVATKRSTDKVSAARGGALGCLDAQQIDPTFAAAAAALPVGGVSAPVKTQYGWHIIKVDDVTKGLPFDEVKGEIRTGLVEQGPAGRAKLEQAMAAAKVTVASKFGRWVVKDGAGRVVAPTSGSTSTTTAPSSSSTSTTTKP